MKGVDMTQGTIWKQLIRFALPLAFAHFLQQSYNLFDAIMVGRFVSSSALAAVSASIPITMMTIAFFMGLSNGASVLIAQFFGAKNREELKNAVHTAVLMAFLIGLVLSLVGIIVSPYMLRLVETPEDVFTEAVVYLRVYFAGLTGITVYNMGAAILTATGDSKRPLYFLAFSMVIKVILNLLFILVLNWGVMAVAWSTVIAQATTAVLVIRLLCRHPSEIKLSLRQLKIHRHILRGILNIGLPGGIQGIIISFSNVIVQTYINSLGGAVMAGYGTNGRMEAFLFAPVAGVGLAIATFVGQNLGSGQVKRAREGARVAVIIGISTTLVGSAIVFTFASNIFQIFTADEQVIHYALSFMQVFVPSYFLLSYGQIMAGALRGSGDVKIPMLLNIACFVVLRQIYLFFATQISHTATTVAIGFPVGWLVGAVGIFIYYKRSNWSSYEKTQTAKE